MMKTSNSTEYIHINSFLNGGNKDDYTIYFYNTGSTTYATPEITKIVRLSANDTFAFIGCIQIKPMCLKFIPITLVMQVIY